MIRRQVNRSDWEKDPGYFGWNAFVDLIAIEDFGDLTTIQRVGSLIFWYDAEVLNGGHLQYFVNAQGKYAVETVNALTRLNMECQRSILIDAIHLLLKHPIPVIDTLEDYVDEARNGTFHDLNMRYYNCSKETSSFLEEYLEDHFDEFVELV